MNEWLICRNHLLTIQTVYPEVVKDVLCRFNLVQESWCEEKPEGYLQVHYPHDQYNQALIFWLGSAVTCGLSERWIQ